MSELSAEPGVGSKITLKVWHPHCWTLRVTEETDAGLLAHTVYNTTGDTVKANFTVYGDTTDDVEALIEAARASELTDSVAVMERRHDFRQNVPSLGNTTRELFVEYDLQNSMSDALVTQGFVHYAPVRIDDGREYWPVFTDEGRDGLQPRIDALREEKDADVEVTKITSLETEERNVESRLYKLSDRQREVFELACELDYYTWPREISTRELADELDISKTTLLEHLRKAEAKLLNPE
ncbi:MULTISPECIES: helix-turn-helix domain-containing protein [Halorussus]|uniref:helix-turn-helix domain-containing protein n=1 Tax=Halorussus TaxID=1070314 RepID=UPI0020A07480|nr:helix-turn-helix domain-containing protein [Halorussus vallis]USZ77951.1 helix-turn-helix domain-containing protein [Halorussus vallis]USZ77985.1 helix-turn-helix domain-containing protein [Halorussus vallis]